MRPQAAIVLMTITWSWQAICYQQSISDLGIPSAMRIKQLRRCCRRWHFSVCWRFTEFCTTSSSVPSSLLPASNPNHFRAPAVGDSDLRQGLRESQITAPPTRRLPGFPLRKGEDKSGCQIALAFAGASCFHQPRIACCVNAYRGLPKIKVVARRNRRSSNWAHTPRGEGAGG